MNKIKIRKSRLEDSDEIFVMISDLENDSLDKNKFYRIFKINLSDSGIHYLVATLGETILGFISLHVQELLHHVGKVAEIQELYVKRNERGAGIGKLLIEKAMEVAESNKCDTIEVSCNIKRKEAHKFYQQRVGLNKTHFKFTKKLLSR